ncbi:DUF4875 domain-containing protein [Escherichia coli]|nr:DUF4875 domain-containing protein [Escherichia coli]EFS7176878.1 DUF4875 domain-containing protein [Escherichia coli]
MLHWVCTKCQSKNSTNELMCHKCGTSFLATHKKGRGGCLLLSVMLFVVFCVVGQLSGNESASQVNKTPPKEHVNDELALFIADKMKPYSFVRYDDISYAGRKRFKVFIVSPESQDLESRASTAMAAAIEWQKEKRADFVSVVLLPTENSEGSYRLAMADYSPDGCGTGASCDNKQWSILSSDIILTKLQLQSISLWNEYKKKFAGNDGILDLKEEKKLKRFIGKQLNIPVKDVFVPDVFPLKKIED